MNILSHAPLLLCSLAIGIALLAMVIYAIARLDRALLSAFLIAAPIYASSILLYSLPLEIYPLLKEVQFEPLDDLYGKQISPALYVILITAATLIMSIGLWVISRRYLAIATKKTYRSRQLPLIIPKQGSIADADDHPYRRNSFDSYL